ncbi:MAG: adenylylsulfate kinase [Peptococcaceae bacterium BRH_c4b]|nr:MAG: adenylylsulfate kinase [Peptococcaceae bacterium BRH_c4b]
MLDNMNKHQGFTVFITGLSGSGKSTLANNLALGLSGNRNRKVTLLDGDIVRKHLSQELGFSKEHRNVNVERVGFVASEITKHGGIAICALIAPYASSRNNNREHISRYGGYVEVYNATPIDVCENRDSKGLYAKARQGIIERFTGVNDPYEQPESPEIVIDTTHLSPDDAVHEVLTYLKQEGYID